MSTNLAIELVLVIGVAIVLLLFWKNKKDERLLNPDDEDAVDENRMDHDRRKERL